MPLSAQETGRLEAVRAAVRGDKKDNTDDQQSRNRSDIHDDGDDGFLDELWAAVLVSPWVVPHVLLHDRFSNDSFFQPNPYNSGHPGEMSINPVHSDEAKSGLSKEENATLKSWMVRVTVDESNDFAGLNRVHGQLLFDTSARFGLQSDWFFLNESLGAGRSDTMTLGDVNLVFRFAECPWMQMRSGLGLRMLFDHGDSKFGFNFTYSADVFPVDPLVATLQFDVGTVGSAALVHGRAALGITRWGWELFAGYDWLRIGTVDLSGPLVGLRLWF